MADTRLVCELKDPHSEEVLLHLADSETICVHERAVASTQGCFDGLDIIEGPWGETTVGVSKMLEANYTIRLTYLVRALRPSLRAI